MPTLSTNRLREQAFEALKSCLSEIPFLEGPVPAHLPDFHDNSPDIAVEVVIADTKHLLLVELKTVGQPRMARESVNQLLRYSKEYPEAYGVFAAPYISPKAAQICTSEGIGYFDLAGNCRFSFGSVFIDRGGKPNPFSDRRDLRSLYSPKATRVLRVLLANPKTIWKLQALADKADVSLGLVFKVKKLLADREWIATDARGFKLIEPETLLTAWAQNYAFRKNEILEFYSSKSVPEIEARIAEVYSGLDYELALTCFSAADRLAPFSRYHKVWAYVSNNIENTAGMLNVKRVDSGANVALLIPYDDGVFYDSSELGGVRVVSPIQTYLDLLNCGERGREAAAYLLEKRIRPSW